MVWLLVHALITCRWNRVEFDFRHSLNGYADWFLSDEKCHSSFQLEVAATEFECQGLELDLQAYVGVMIFFSMNGSGFTELHGSKWQQFTKEIDNNI